MNKKGKIILLILLTLLLTSALAMNFIASLEALLTPPKREKYDDPVTIDFITIQSLVKAVAVKDIPLKSNIQLIDSLNQICNLAKIHNPFVKKPRPRSSSARKARSSSKSKSRRRAPRITVNGIVWDESKPYAILNGEVYGVEDEIKGYVVRSITDSLVMLSSTRGSFTLKYRRE